MILALYILKSTLAMSIMLIFYKFFLEREKMHYFNRVYLLGAILLSMIVPFLPTGLPIASTDIQPVVESISSTHPVILDALTDSVQTPLIDLSRIFITLYLVVLSFFTLKFGKNLFFLVKKVKGNETRYYKGARIVLLDDSISPFTFWNYIFLRRKDYESNKVDQQLLDHELTHARQKHSWDILFIEFVMLIFWFNPILRWYKTAIQLNHEFLADDSVIEKYKTVKTYQYLLLDTIENNNKIYLASNINFHLTQKRLKMMTKKSSSMRKKVLIFSIVPMIIGLLIGFGNPAISQNENTQINKTVGSDSGIAKDKYFEHSIVNYTTKDGKTKAISYKSLSKDVKSKIPPPPSPPVPPGTKQKNPKIDPLPKGTIVYLTDDGSIHIGDKKKGVMAPPPPPPPNAPKAAKKIFYIKAPVPPSAAKAAKAPIAPVAPIPPPPPPTFDDLAKEGAKFYFDGKEVSVKEVQRLWKDGIDDIEKIDVKKGKDGKKTVHITKK